ncbi:MAG: DNA polymerase subunit beta [Leptolyngbya sp. RL_3_1]|nr:DNA polymerase subunit beta [Leptolyngbya sp. RL_3_1]
MNTTATPTATQAIYDRLGITPEQLTTFCQQWHVAELSFFGAILQDDFTATSDVDVLVTYLPTANPGLFEKLRMEAELEALLHHNVDLVNKAVIAQSSNWLRRKNILNSAAVFYVA